jgi:phosphoglycerate kinase
LARFATIDDFDVAGKRVLLRADLNVPVAAGKIEDDTRIERVVPSLAELAERGARIVVISHFGRPGGKPDPAQSLRPMVPALARALGRPVAFAADCVGPAAEKAVAALKPGEVVVLENTRFHPGEESNDPEFARALAALGDFYVDDAFSTAHRAHASTTGVADYLPAAAGRLMEAELKALGRALDKPARPLMALVGGAKVSTKLDLLANLCRKVDMLAIGGAMANTLLAAQGIDIGQSLHEPDMFDDAMDLLAQVERERELIILPLDAVVAPKLEAGIATETVPVECLPPGKMILDIGPKTVAEIVRRLGECRTLVWNGPVGAFETQPFDRGTVALAHEVAKLTKQGKLVSIAGGGDTVAALSAAGVIDDLTYVSTAGGAFLEWLEGRSLPGVAALERHRPKKKT